MFWWFQGCRIQQRLRGLLQFVTVSWGLKYAYFRHLLSLWLRLDDLKVSDIPGTRNKAAMLHCYILLRLTLVQHYKMRCLDDTIGHLLGSLIDDTGFEFPFFKSRGGLLYQRFYSLTCTIHFRVHGSFTCLIHPAIITIICALLKQDMHLLMWYKEKRKSNCKLKQ